VFGGICELEHEVGVDFRVRYRHDGGVVVTRGQVRLVDDDLVEVDVPQHLGDRVAEQARHRRHENPPRSAHTCKETPGMAGQPPQI